MKKNPVETILGFFVLIFAVVFLPVDYQIGSVRVDFFAAP